MIQFFIRLFIVACGVIIVGVMNGLHGLPFFGAMIFGCTWLCYRPFEAIAAWLVFYIMILLVFFEHSAWLYAVIGIGSFYIFDIMHAYLVRNNSANKFMLFVMMIVLASVSVIGVHMITMQTVFFGDLLTVATVVGAPLIFFVLAVIISYAEGIIGLYVYADQRCHT